MAQIKEHIRFEWFLTLSALASLGVHAEFDLNPVAKEVAAEKRLIPHESILHPSPWAHYPRDGILDHLSYAFTYGTGKPGNVLGGVSKDLEFEAKYHFEGFFNRLDAGLFIRSTSSGYDETLDYDTGFHENRSYSLKVLTFGPSVRLRIYDGLHLFASGGISKTSSLLSKISTDAPVDPSLAVGYSVPIPTGYAAIGGLSYEYRWSRFGVGLQAGYNISAVNLKESLSEMYAGIYVRFFQSEWNYPAFFFQ